MNDQDLIYHELILELYRHPLNKKKLDDFTFHHKEFNPLCGDEVELFIKTDKDDKIIDIGFLGQGCALSQASTSILTEVLKKKTLTEAYKITTQEILQKLGLKKLNPTRLRCVGLPVEALQKISPYVPSN
jgi:nitrogen fixation NifU-like protein